MRRTIVLAAAMLMLLAGSASAQKPVPRYGETESKTPAEIAQEKAAERAYRSSLGNIPAKPDVDPWGNARGTDSKTDKSVAKSATPAKPKPAKPPVAAN